MTALHLKVAPMRIKVKEAKAGSDSSASDDDNDLAVPKAKFDKMQRYALEAQENQLIPWDPFLTYG